MPQSPPQPRSKPTQAPSFEQQFEHLDSLLTRLRRYWQLRTFEPRVLPWTGTPLGEWLEGLDADQRQLLLNDDRQRAAALAPYIPEAAELLQLTQIESAVPDSAGAADDSQTIAALPDRLSSHIPGRKWQQICAFEQALTSTNLPYLEWCAGKGHLGRLLAYRHRQTVTSLELQPALSEQGQQLSDRFTLPCHHHRADVMDAEVSQWLSRDQHAVALHACGKLHMRLLEHAGRVGIEALSLSPCCYHLIDEQTYQPLSQAAQGSELTLSRYDLSLAVQETVTAGARERRLRDQQLAWRLGFDLLQRQLRGVDHYLNCPTIPQSRLSGSFSEFCYWMADKKSLDLDAAMKKGTIDMDTFEQQGWQRVELVEQMEILRQLFRRPLEIWLALDRVLFLEQQGYRVRLNRFCERQLTPRNLLIQALRN